MKTSLIIAAIAGTLSISGLSYADQGKDKLAMWVKLDIGQTLNSLFIDNSKNDNTGITPGGGFYLLSNDAKVNQQVQVGGKINIQNNYSFSETPPLTGYYIEFGHMRELSTENCSGSLKAASVNVFTIEYNVSPSCPSNGNGYSADCISCLITQ